MRANGKGGVALAVLLAGLGAAPVFADHGNKDGVIALVRRGVEAIRRDGAIRTYAAITDKRGPHTHEEFYLVVYGLDGMVLAHGADGRLIGRNLIDATDVDGKAFVKERVALAKSKGRFWHQYKFTNPVTKRIEPKQMYCERVAETVVCGGVYK